MWVRSSEKITGNESEIYWDWIKAKRSGDGGGGNDEPQKTLF